MFRPNSAIFGLEYSIWGKLSVWSKCKWEGGDKISFTNMGIVAEMVLAQDGRIRPKHVVGKLLYLQI